MVRGFLAREGYDIYGSRPFLNRGPHSISLLLFLAIIMDYLIKSDPVPKDSWF
jgi:hypothetical protein